MQLESKKTNSEPVQRASASHVDEGHTPEKQSSRLPGFYELPITERQKVIQASAALSDQEREALSNFGVLKPELVDVFIENGVGVLSMPLGVATNFKINGRDVLVPMAVEETSVVAAASHGAKLVRAGGGFFAESTPPVMTGQIQLLLADLNCDVDVILNGRKNALLEFANRGQDRLVARGGGAIDLTWRLIPEIKSLVIHLHCDTRDAMGANIINTMCEKVSQLMPDLFPGCEVGLRILTNLNDRRLTSVSCTVPASVFTTRDYAGEYVVERIVKAYLFAKHDIYRATTNNKGVMNGIDPVLIATGNDWRAVEAGAHAYAARDGQYRPMVEWSMNEDGNLVGFAQMPMAVGVVGGVTKLHPTARTALRVMGDPDAQTLANIVTSVGVAQNLSALRALATEGIQRGHMSLHRHNLDLLRREGASRG